MKSIREYYFGNVKGDIYGGIIAAVVALPLALAFGVSSGAGAIAGLYGAIGVGFFAALVGGTPSQVSGPTGPMTVVMAAIITDFVGQYPENGLALAFSVVVLGGIFQILFGVLKLGKYISMVPYSVISGFMSGIGIIIIILEIPFLFGYPASGGVLKAVGMMPEALMAPHWVELAIGLGTIALIYLWPKKLKAIIPAPLLALFVFSIGVAVLLPHAGVNILGEIPSGFPKFIMPTFAPDLIVDMIKSGLVLALLGTIDSLLTSLVADNVTRTHHNPERELIGQGIGNIAAGLFGGLPGAGATMRTVVNVQNGGRQPLSGMLHSLILLAVVLGLGKYASYIPHAVLAGILVTVGIGIIDWKFMLRMSSFPKRIVVIVLTVMLVTVFVDLITAVAIGIVMASLSTIKRMADLQTKFTQEITHENVDEHLGEKHAALLKAHGSDILMYRLQGILSFAAAKAMLKTLSQDREYKVLVLDLTYVPMVDVTTALTMDEIIETVKSRGKEVRFVGLRQEILSQFEKLISDRETLEGRHYPTLDEALVY